MAEGAGKVSKQLSLNKFFDPSTPSMRKGRDREKQVKKKTGKKREKTDGNSGHYVIASSRPPERRPLERRTLAPKRWVYLRLGSRSLTSGCHLNIRVQCHIKGV